MRLVDGQHNSSKKTWLNPRRLVYVVIICFLFMVISVVDFELHPHTSQAATVLPPADQCQLSQLAFCDTFASSVGGGRAGGIDPGKWTFSRITSAVLAFQNMLNNYPPVTANVCGTQQTVQPPHDVFVCGSAYGQPGHVGEAINDNGIYDGSVRLSGGGTHPEYYEGNVVVSSMRALQPIDFSGRTGNIVFDVDASLDSSGLDQSHGWWPEVWITDQPAQAPHINAAHVSSVAQNAIGFVFNSCNGISANQNLGGLNEINVINNYVATTLTPAQTCYATKENGINHFQIKISQSSVQVWASDVGGSNFRMVASQAVNLNFSRGYISFEQAHYNAAKYGYSETNTLAWHAIGFDGPVIPTDRDYQAPDALHVVTSAEAQNTGAPTGSVNLGYQLGTCSSLGCPCPPASFGSSQCPESAYATPNFALSNVDLSNVTQAYLTYSAWYDLGSHQFDAVLNGTKIPLVDPNTFCSDPNTENCYSGLWRTVVLPIPTSDLRSGNNSLTIEEPSNGQGQNPTIANIDLELQHNP